MHQHNQNQKTHSNKHGNQSKYSHERIRNLSAFLKSYMQGERGQTMLNRPVRYREETAPNSKGKPVTHLIPRGYNTMAHALHKAVTA